MSRGRIVDDMIDEIRSLTDEYNSNQLSDLSDILPSLNRGLEKGIKVLTRVFPDPILNYVEVPAVSTKEISLPENIWEDKVLRTEWISSGTNVIPKECQLVGIRLLSQHETGAMAVDRPDCYSMYERKMRFSGLPNGRATLRIWYIREVDSLVKSYARITDLDEASGTLYIGEASTDFDPTTGVTQGDWNRCINVVDGQTGIIKGSFEVGSYNGSDTIVINASRTRTIVLNRDIGTTLVDMGINADDYICPVRGTCVLYFFDALHVYCIQYAVAELKRKLGYAYDADQALLKDFESELKKTYMGRSLGLRIAQNNPNWLRGSQRRFYRGFKY